MQTTIERPARRAGATSHRLAKPVHNVDPLTPNPGLHNFVETPEGMSAAHTLAGEDVRKLRALASAEIDRLIAFLDETDGFTMDERETDSADDEPALGSIEDHPNPYLDGTDYPGCGRDQSYWAGGSTDDCEGDEHDGREPDDDEGGEAEKEDDEPSLGWTDVETRCGRYVNNGTDLEIDEVRA